MILLSKTIEKQQPSDRCGWIQQDIDPKMSEHTVSQVKSTITLIRLCWRPCEVLKHRYGGLPTHCAQACCRDLEAEDDDKVAEQERAGSSDGSESTEDEDEPESDEESE